VTGNPVRTRSPGHCSPISCSSLVVPCRARRPVIAPPPTGSSRSTSSLGRAMDPRAASAEMRSPERWALPSCRVWRLVGPPGRSSRDGSPSRASLNFPSGGSTCAASKPHTWSPAPSSCVRSSCRASSLTGRPGSSNRTSSRPLRQRPALRTRADDLGRRKCPPRGRCSAARAWAGVPPVGAGSLEARDWILAAGDRGFPVWDSGSRRHPSHERPGGSSANLR